MYTGMVLLIFGLLIFLCSFIVHVALWRTISKIRSVRNMILLFTVLYVLSLVLIIFIAAFNVYEIIHIYLVALSLLSAYIISYPGIESDSPSNVILLTIRSKGDAGAVINDLRESLTDEISVLERLRGLENEMYIRNDGGRYYITPRGIRFLTIFILIRKLFTTESFGG